MEFGSSKAKLGKILETSLANKRAADDLMGISGIKGAFVVDMSGSIPITMSIATTTAGTVEIQTISFDNTPTSGSWELSYDGAGTGALAWNISSADLQTALRTIPDLASVTVSGSMAAGFSISMVGVASPLIIVMAANTLMASVTPVVETIAVGTPYVAEIQHIDFGTVPDAGLWTLSYAGNATANINFNDIAATVEAALQLVPGCGSITVTGDYTAGFDVTMNGIAAPVLLVAPAHTLTTLGVPVVVTPSVGTPETFEIQNVSFGTLPTSGSWTLSYAGNATGALAYNISAVDLQTALQLVAGLGSVTVAGSMAAGFDITMTGISAPALLVMASNTLMSDIAVVETIAVGTPWVPAQETISFSDVPTAGSWELNYGTDLSGALAWNISAVNLQAALQAMPGLGSVTVAGSFATNFVVTMAGVALPVTTFGEEANTLERPGVADAIDVGTGFSAEPGSTAGSFNIYLDKRPINYLGSKVSVFTPKATAANGDIFEADVSAYDFSASRPYVTVRIVNKTTRAVYAPLASCVFMFEINCTYSDDSGY